MRLKVGKPVVVMKPVDQIIREKGLAPGGDVQKQFTHTVMNHMEKYMPYRTGALIKEMRIHTNVTAPHGFIVVPGKRAIPLYYGVQNGKPINYTKPVDGKGKGHPLAGPHWEKRMWAAEGAQIQRDAGICG